MNKTKRKIINLPLGPEVIETLRAGDTVSLNGTVYTARDAAHKKIEQLILSEKPLPFNIKNSVIYYTGPCPAKSGEIIGSAGPTTSSRMDAYTPALLEKGLKGMIGKGERAEKVKRAIVKNKAIYFGATGGCGALISECIKSCEVIAFKELGTEAVREIRIENFPAVVIIDSKGNNIYEKGREEYKKQNI